MEVSVYVVCQENLVIGVYISEEEASKVLATLRESRRYSNHQFYMNKLFLTIPLGKTLDQSKEDVVSYNDAIEAILNKREFTDLSKRALMEIIFRNASSDYYQLVVSIMEKSDGFFNARSFLETLNASEVRK